MNHETIGVQQLLLTESQTASCYNIIAVSTRLFEQSTHHVGEKILFTGVPKPITPQPECVVAGTESGYMSDSHISVNLSLGSTVTGMFRALEPAIAVN